MSELPLALDLLIATLMVVGAFFALVGAFGLAKLSDFMKRLHGPTKATTLGVGFSLLASIAWFAWSGDSTGRELLVTLFVFITAPVSAHLLVKAALRSGSQARPPPVPEHPQRPDA